MTATTRLNWFEVAPDGAKALLGIHHYILDRTALPEELIHLVFLRVSQINGCAHCLDMHTKEARASGETEQRLHVLAAWRDAPFYSGRERAALAWAEALTQISTHAISDELFAEARDHFGEKGLVDLTLAIIAINGWNRLAVPFRAETGSYQPA